MIKILHITPHMGGGVGNVISGYAKSDPVNEHQIVLLEKPIDDKYLKILERNHTNIFTMPSYQTLLLLLISSDIVIVHWWHHPLTSQFLYELPNVPLRVVIWCHISNLTVPNLNAKIVDEATHTFFTTESSYQSKNYASLDDRVLMKKTSVVPGSLGFDDSIAVKKIQSSELRVGYLGFIDFSKLHANFIDYCLAIELSDVRFIMGGNAPAKTILEEEAKRKGILNQFEFKGFIDNVYDFYSTIDILGYPLMPQHTCTTENAILEAMVSEVPPILINQLVEKDIVSNGKTGFLVNSPEEYGKVIRFLHDHPEKRIEIGKNARKDVLAKYDKAKLLNNFLDQCNQVLGQEKKYHDFKKILGDAPDEWFLSSIGEEAEYFKLKHYHKISSILKGENKASVIQYASYFNNNVNLKHWATSLRE